MWNPKKSNLLQVLLSILAIVIVEEPYFNEAGYMSQKNTPNGIKNSIQYNENVALLNLKHLIKIHRNPPTDCIKIIQNHIKNNFQIIYDSYNYYIQNTFEKKFDDFALIESPSKGFMLTLKKLLIEFSGLKE
jgi:ubiquitin-conjugating enzyme E2 O